MSALQQSEAFQVLDLKVQTVITKLAQSPQSFDELKSLIQVEDDLIKQHITKEFQQHRRDLAHERYCHQFLESLWYPEIRRRQETVSEAHQRTFQWIYEPDGFDTSTCQWHNMVQWFEKGEGIYWISGKAGSGKSTLMNYISLDDRTSDSLKAWSGSKDPFKISHFFWSAGTTLEKSWEGLLRSLLYQILRKFPSLTPLSCESQSALGPPKDDLQKREPIAAWTERRLQTTFQSVMRQTQGICRICIFIDGLDETSGDPDAMITMIEDMQSVDVKVCLSSRPDLWYNEAFGSCAMLRLQDLTEPDIKTYVFDKLQPYLLRGSPVDVSNILNSIVRQAQGVFLWVELVVKALIKGLKTNDSLKQLRTRIESTPSDIEGLYTKILSSIDVAHHEEAARLFQMALTKLTGSLLDVALALYKVFDRVPKISVQEALHFSDLTRKRIPTICAGFLEVNVEDKNSEEGGGKFNFQDHHLSLPIRYTCSQEIADVSFYERYAHVDFIHRTAVDFLRQSKQGQIFLGAMSQSCPSPHSLYVRALLAKVNLLGFPEKPANVDANFEKDVELSAHPYLGDRCDDFADRVARIFVCETMQNLSLGDWATGAAQASLCDDVDRTLATVSNRYQGVFPMSHWSTHWGLIGPKKRHTEVVSWSRTSSRSSSRDSFYSARGESLLFHDEPVDFVGLAASWTLTRYVLKKIDSQRRHLNKELVNYLLCCSIRPLYNNEYPLHIIYESPKELCLIAELLSRGGDPNIYVERFSTTIWGLFLSRTRGWGAHEAQMALAMTAKTFLENGADVHIKLIRQVSAIGVWRGPPAGKYGGSLEMGFRYEASALYVLRSWLEHNLELETLEEIILAKGGRESHRYTHVALNRDGYRPYRISERRHERIVPALFAARMDRRGVNIRMPVDLCWTQQLEEIYKDISEGSDDSESQISLDEDVTSGADAGEFHDLVGTQTVAGVRESQPSDRYDIGRKIACDGGLAK